MLKQKEKKISQELIKDKEAGISTIEFFFIGIACHALCLIKHADILKKLEETGAFDEKQIFKFKNFHLIKAALNTLVGANVLHFNDHIYVLSELGKRVAKNIGLITVPLNGYRKLFSKQFQLLKKYKIKDSDIDFRELSLASTDFGKDDLDPLIFDILKGINQKGTICDLGCGNGARLRKICKTFNTPGLGIEKSKQAINQSKKYINEYLNVEIIKGDINDLKNVREDVGVGMMNFVFHDIISPIPMLHSFRKTFPNMKYFILVDIVSTSRKVPTSMPGFDYVHGLQGVTTRNYEETLETFKEANYKISKEIPVPNMPNTFIWVLV